MSSKKLSLEERLSLATKKGKKKSRKAANLSESLVQQDLTTSNSFTSLKSIDSSNSVDLDSPIANEISTIGVSDDVGTEASLVNLVDEEKTDLAETCVEAETSTENTSTIADDSVLKNILPEKYEELKIEELLEAISPHIIELTKKNKQLEAQAKNATSQTKTKSHDNSSFIKLIREKDEKIKILEYESKNNAMKEESLNQNLNALQKNLNKQLEVNKRQIDELQLKTNAYSALFNEYEIKQKEFANLELTTHEYKEELDRLQDLDQLLKEKDSFIKSLENSLIDVNREKEIEKENLHEEVEELRKRLEADKLSFERREKALNQANFNQITAFEAKIEELRIELDNSNRTKSNRDLSKTSEDGDTANNESSHISDLHYQNIHEQLEASKANWESIEYALNNKLATLELQLQDSEAERDQLQTDVKSRDDRIVELEEEIEQLRKKLESLEVQIGDLEHEIVTSNTKLQDLTEDHEMLQKKFEIQRLPMTNNGIQTPTKDNVLSILTPATPSLGISRSVSDDWFESANGPAMETKSSLNLPSSNYNGSESNETIIHHSDNEMEQIEEPSNVSMTNISMSLTDIPDEASELQLIRTASRKTSHSTLPTLHRKTSTQLHNSVNNSNAQMVSRLGGELRRMETELSSLKASNERLQLEKSKINGEILRLMEENDTVAEVKSNYEKMNAKAIDLEKKLETSLVLLGEKTERVEELQNDVADLKDMLHEQVNQMVSMQEKLR